MAPLVDSRRLGMDLSPLRTSRDFRLLFAGGSVSLVGSMMTFVAVPFQIKQLTGSYVAVGLVGLAELVPMVVFGLWGGALADAVDRRRMVLLTEVGFTALTALLLVNAVLPRPFVWPLYAFAAAVAALDGLQRPSLDAMLPRIVAHDELPAAGALTSLRWTLGSILGPSLGGLVAATVGVAWVYGADAVSFVASLLALVLMSAVPPPSGSDRPSLAGIVEGVRYAWHRKDLLGTYVVDMAAMVLAMPIALFPFVATQMYDAPWSLGLLYSAQTVGGLAVTLTSGWVSRYPHHGRAILAAAAVWGAGIAGFGLTRSVWVGLAFLAVSGAGDMVSGLFRMAMWNQTIPDELRGRLAGIELLSYSSGPMLGQIRAAGVARAVSLRASIVSGGLLCVLVVGGLAAVLPSFRGYDERSDPHAAAQRARRSTAVAG